MRILYGCEHMRYLFIFIFCLTVFTATSYSQCIQQAESTSHREKWIGKFRALLMESNPSFARATEDRFFIYDLTDPTNWYFGGPHDCINFVDKHIYHVAPIEYGDSESMIVILDRDNLTIFKAVNCETIDRLSDVIKYVKRNLHFGNKSHEVLTRLANYREYGFYSATDFEKPCSVRQKGSEKPAYGINILAELRYVVEGERKEKMVDRFSNVGVEDGRGIGFFIVDLNNPANKQTSLLERVNLIEGHVYHFAAIDLPYSVSNIAYLEGGKVKFFKSLNCDGGGTVKDVIDFLRPKLKGVKNKTAILERVRNYRKYGVYAALNGISTPQCTPPRS